MIKILFVCLGNICRSPLAEAIFNKKIKELELQNSLLSDSAGTSGYHVGDIPDSRTISVANKYQVPIDHYGQLFSADLAADFNYILAMDTSNLNNIKKVTGPSENIFLMRHFDFLYPNADVPDPYYGGADGFEDVYQILNRSVDGFIKFLLENHPALNLSNPYL